MTSHLVPHRPTSLPGLSLAVLCAALLLAACAGPRPEVQVIGVSQARSASSRADGKHLLVFLEVVNPTERDLRLSRLEYQLHAAEWLDAEGRVAIGRGVGAGSSTVVEIPVPLDRASGRMPEGVHYTLEGKIFARENHVERSWKVAVKGALSGRSAASPSLRLRVAGAE